MADANLIISPFQPTDQAQVKALIQAGLGEHWGWIDPARNPDLNDIQATYAEALFLVARQGDAILGTGALVPRPEGRAEIVRMSVAAEARRQGIGRRILQRLVEEARRRGYRQVYLETTATWTEVIEFYLHSGFHITHYWDGDVYFSLDLAGTGSASQIKG